MLQIVNDLPIRHYTFANVGDAINALVICRRIGIRASYHPGGGSTEKIGTTHAGGLNVVKNTPVTHSVFAMAEIEKLENFEKEMEKIK